MASFDLLLSDPEASRNVTAEVRRGTTVIGTAASPTRTTVGSGTLFVATLTLPNVAGDAVVTWYADGRAVADEAFATDASGDVVQPPDPLTAQATRDAMALTPSSGVTQAAGSVPTKAEVEAIEVTPAAASISTLWKRNGTDLDLVVYLAAQSGESMTGVGYTVTTNDQIGIPTSRTPDAGSTQYTIPGVGSASDSHRVSLGVTTNQRSGLTPSEQPVWEADQVISGGGSGGGTGGPVSHADVPRPFRRRVTTRDDQSLFSSSPITIGAGESPNCGVDLADWMRHENLRRIDEMAAPQLLLSNGTRAAQDPRFSHGVTAETDYGYLGTVAKFRPTPIANAADGVSTLVLRVRVDGAWYEILQELRLKSPQAVS